MPIRINLKELFSADSQSIVIDKINFNFNKLLELGVGEPGEKGFSGIQGAAGPIGLTGDQGIRGATWFVDAAQNPNTLTFVDLLEGDLYLDSNNLAIWQYDGTQWDFVVDITNVINNYLVASPSPFKRGFGISTPNDDRFILFNKRDDAFDTQLGINNSNSQNDILFLNNYDEDAITPFIYGPADNPTGSQVDTNEYYNSLLSISVDHRSLSTGRYHLELGSLYLDGSDPKLTTTFDNFKIRFIREDGSLHSGQTHYHKTIFSLDLPEVTLSGGLDRTTNGIFEFLFPKFLPSVENTSFNIYMGSKYGLDEVAMNGSGFINSDGILFSSGGAFGNVGLIDGFLIPDYPTSNGYVANSANNAYLWLESLDANGIMLNDIVLQNGGNIVQLGTTTPRAGTPIVSKKGAPNTTDFLYSGAITILGNEVYTGFGNTNIYNGTNTDLLKFGYFNKFSISDPNNPTSDFISLGLDYIKFDGRISGAASSPSCNQAYQLAENPIGPGLKDMVSDGDYIYAVNSQRYDKNPGSSTSGGSTYTHTAFQILRKNSKNDIGLTRISRLGVGSFSGGDATLSQINGASRIKLFGKYVIVTTNTLQGWTNYTNISDPTILSSYDGKITAIDISDPLNPRIESSASVIPTKVLTSPSTTAIMDLDIVDDYAFTVTWEQTNGTTTADVQIRFDAFDLRGLKRDDPSTSGTIQWIGRGQTTILPTTTLNSGAISAFSKTAAISSDGRYVYIGYGQNIYKYNFNTLNGARSGTYPDCYSLYNLNDQITVTSAGSRQIVDIKIIGNSLYVLLSDASDGQFVKFEVRDILTQSYSKLLTGQAVSRFENSGKHFYIACQNSVVGETNTNSLIAIDFDGFYTAGAHIESLRSDDVNVTKDLKVGGSLNVATTLNVGSGAQIQGHLGVEKAIQTPYLINDEGSLTIASSKDDVIINAADDIKLNATNISTSSIELNSSYLISTNSTNSTTLTSGNDIVLTASDDIFLLATGALSQIKLDSSLTRPSATAGVAMPNLAIQTIGEISPNNLTIAPNNQGVIVTRQNPAITSGSFTYTYPLYINACTMNWIKVGTIVHVTGYVDYATGSNGTGGAAVGAIPLPVILDAVDGAGINELYGSGTAYIKDYTVGALTYDSKMVAVEIKQGVGSNLNKNYFAIVYEPNVTAADDNDAADKRYLTIQSGANGTRHPVNTGTTAGLSNAINARANIRFSFSYRLDN